MKRPERTASCSVACSLSAYFSRLLAFPFLASSSRSPPRAAVRRGDHSFLIRRGGARMRASALATPLHTCMRDLAQAPLRRRSAYDGAAFVS